MSTDPGSGFVGDKIFDVAHHGGHDRAVYSYAREDLDFWEFELGKVLPCGIFGENMTTVGLDLTSALIGERWLVGGQVVLEVSGPRTPCGTFACWMNEDGWAKRFISRATPGAFLRVIEPGVISARNTIEIVKRPSHGITIQKVFRALLTDADLLPHLLAADALPESIKVLARKKDKKDLAT